MNKGYSTKVKFPGHAWNRKTVIVEDVTQPDGDLNAYWCRLSDPDPTQPDAIGFHKNHLIPA